MRTCSIDQHHQSIVHIRVSLTAAALTAIVLATTASGQCIVQPSEKLVALGGAPGDRFGHNIALDDNIMVIGAYRDDDICGGVTSCNSGSVHIYRRQNTQWIYEAELHADDLAPGDQFGRSVAISGTTIIVGSPLSDDVGSASGSAYIFVYSKGQWTQQAKLTAADAASGDTFGDAVSIQGNTAIIGALRDDNAAGSNAGAAYVFTAAGNVWTQQAKLIPNDAEAADNFGNTIDIDGDTIIVGSENDDDPVIGRNAGSAYIFTNYDGVWTQTAKLLAGSMGMDDRFGWAVQLLGETAVVSSLEEDNRGAVYIFMRNVNTSWRLHQRLVSDDLTTFDDFGHSLALSETTLIVGASSDDDACGGSPSCDSGSAYIFDINGGNWTQTTKLTAFDASSDDEFGYSVAMSGGTIIVGARRNEQLGNDAGAVYEFSADCFVTTCTGDLDSDGLIGVGDLIMIITEWGAGGKSPADINNDGVVNVFDLIELFSNWGPCSQSK